MERGFIRILIMPDICIFALVQPVSRRAQAHWPLSLDPFLHTVLPVHILPKDKEVEQLGSHTATPLTPHCFLLSAQQYKLVHLFHFSDFVTITVMKNWQTYLALFG